MEASRPATARMRFGDFEANLGSGELRRQGLRLRLADQSFRVLELLLENAGQLVTRDQLRQRLWTRHSLVDFEAGLNSAIKRLRAALHDSADAPRFVETLPRRGYRFLASVERISETAPVSLRVESVAVLPLENLTGDPAQDYFVDGMTDALITRLAQIRALRVISRTSAMRYKNTREPLPDIARRLKVDAVIEGTVTRSGQRVRITAQLIHAASDRHLWASHYERDLTDVLLLQAEVAWAIVEEIRVQLTPQEQARLASGRRVDPAAYEAYLRGRLHWNKRTEEGMRKGLELFEQALEKDPSFALSHAGVAEAYNMMAFWGVAAPREVSPRAKAAALEALAMDTALAEAHAALGWACFAYDWDWPAGEREFRQAIELDPGNATAHQWYSYLLVEQGRVPEALAQVRRSLDLDPLSLVVNASAGMVHLLARQYEEAIERIRATLELDPHFGPPYLCLGWALQEKGMHSEALEALRQAVTLSGSNPRCLAGLGYGYAFAGRAADAASVLAQLQQLATQRYVSAHDFAVVYAGLGKVQETFAWLEKAFEERSAWLGLLNADSRFDAVRSDARFHDLTRRIGFAAA